MLDNLANFRVGVLPHLGVNGFSDCLKSQAIVNKKVGLETQRVVGNKGLHPR
ncbi:hypothetical protein [Nostoc sp.]|uniref:hypothetical protein n=1 Tax=Nostoc sp. TaxID=1180 RepID=UPI002FF76D2E